MGDEGVFCQEPAVQSLRYTVCDEEGDGETAAGALSYGMVSGGWRFLSGACILMKDVVTIGIDTSGVSLHKRGYRQLSSKAPITETLAAALIMLTPWRRDRILVDPFCGSGTFPIEAAMMAANIAPGMNRSFTAEQWTNLIPRKLWYEVWKRRQI